MKRKTTLAILIILAIFLIIFTIKNYYLSEDDREIILHYLDNELIPPSFGGDFTSSFKLLGTGDGEIYVWTQVQEYYQENGKMKKGTGMSDAVVLMADRSGEQLEIIGHKEPKNGEYYGPSIKELFPRRLHGRIFSFPESSRRIEQLEKEIEERLNH